MTREVLHFENEADWLAARVRDVTSTESSALFGLCPYVSEFELHYRKKNATVVEIPDNARMRWGRRNQRTVADGIAEDYGWKIRALNAYVRDPDLRIGASFDFEIVSHPNGVGILEIKTVDYAVYKEEWTRDEAPAHIEIQLQHQLDLMDRSWGAIGVLIGGNDARVIERQRDRELGAAIRTKIAEFWKSVVSGSPPEPDLAHDAAFISKLYGYAEPGKVMDARGDVNIAVMCSEYAIASAAEKQAKENKERAHAAILMAMGDNERLIADGYNVTAGIVAEAPISYVRAAYRGFRLTKQKGKV